VVVKLMAKQTVKFSAKVDFKMDVEKAKKDLKSFEKSLQDVANMSDVSKKRKQEASDLAQRMTKMASTDTSKMNPEQLKKHQQDLNKLKQEYFKLTNAISNARVAEIQGHEDIKDKLEVQNSKYKKIAGSIGQYLKSLERIRSTTALITQEAEKGKQLMGDIGVDFTNPSSIKSKMESIPRGARGGFKNTADKELYKQLEEHLKKINELTDNGKNTVETLEEEYSRVTTELNKQMELAAQIRENKAAIVQEVVQAALQEGKITQEEADQIIAQQKELDLEQEITEEKQKQKALDAGTDIKKNIKESKKLADTNQQVKKSFLGKVTAATLYYAALRALKKLMSSVVNTVRELDKSITEVAMVTSLNRKDA
jgi:chromosome segregation ATPase